MCGMLCVNFYFVAVCNSAVMEFWIQRPKNRTHLNCYSNLNNRSQTEVFHTKRFLLAGRPVSKYVHLLPGFIGTPFDLPGYDVCCKI